MLVLGGGAGCPIRASSRSVLAARHSRDIRTTKYDAYVHENTMDTYIRFPAGCVAQTTRGRGGCFTEQEQLSLSGILRLIAQLYLVGLTDCSQVDTLGPQYTS